MARHKDVVDLTLFTMTSFKRHIAKTLAASFTLLTRRKRPMMHGLVFIEKFAISDNWFVIFQGDIPSTTSVKTLKSLLLWQIDLIKHDLNMETSFQVIMKAKYKVSNERKILLDKLILLD